MKAVVKPMLGEGVVENRPWDGDYMGILFVAAVWLLFYGLMFGGFGPMQHIHVFASVL